MTTQVALVGASGKLGRIIHGVVDAMEGFAVTRVLGSGSDLAEIDGTRLVIDASVPHASGDVVRAAAALGINVLVGTSGWSAERIAEVRPVIDRAGTGLVIIPNFSLGSALGTALAALAAPFFPSAEIIEAHRDTKIDSPSGTAVRTAELVAASRTAPMHAPYADQPARGQQVAGVPVHSLRRPGVIAHQEVYLSGPGESLVITHDTVEPALAYAPGIRLAVPFARDARGVVVGLENIIDLGIRA